MKIDITIDGHTVTFETNADGGHSPEGRLNILKMLLAEARETVEASIYTPMPQTISIHQNQTNTNVADHPAKPRWTFARLTVNGETKSILDWSKITGIPYSTLFSRFRCGWTADEIFNTPPGEKRPSSVSKDIDSAKTSQKKAEMPKRKAANRSAKRKEA